jgi:hypothetical protein
MLARCEVSFFDSARRFEAALAFEEQFHSFSAAEPANRTYISRQSNLLKMQLRVLKLFFASVAGSHCEV